MTVVEMTRTTFVIRNVQAVLPTGVVDDATVVVEDGTVVGVAARADRPPGAIDGAGALCLPGLVDTHSDGFEKELRPRAGRAAAVRLRDALVRGTRPGRRRHDDVPRHRLRGRRSTGRSVPLANELCDAIERRQRVATSTSSTTGSSTGSTPATPMASTASSNGWPTSRPTGRVPLVSFEDHTPGQGQYADRRTFEDYLMATQGLTAAEARDDVDARITERAAMLANRDAALPWLRPPRGARRHHAPRPRPDDARGRARGRDLARPHRRVPDDDRGRRGGRELGLSIVCGAPNVLRGQSHSGNVSAAELIGRGLCDSLASDYMPSTLLGAVVTLVDRGTCGLPEAVRLVTGGPAGVVGLADRGRLEPGSRGDVVVVVDRRIVADGPARRPRRGRRASSRGSRKTAR